MMKERICAKERITYGVLVATVVFFLALELMDRQREEVFIESFMEHRDAVHKVLMKSQGTMFCKKDSGGFHCEIYRHEEAEHDD